MGLAGSLIQASASEGVEKALSDPVMMGTLALMASSLAEVLSPNVLLYMLNREKEVCVD